MPTYLEWYWHVGVFVAIAGKLKLGMELVILFVLVLRQFDFSIPCSENMHVIAVVIADMLVSAISPSCVQLLLCHIGSCCKKALVHFT